MRAERGTWEPPPAFVIAVWIGEHLGHAGAIGPTEVEGDVYAITRDVGAVDLYHFTTGQPRGLFALHLTTSGWPRGLFACHMTATG